jgi:glycerophosphoryl diester phosphodiesterase
MSPARRAVERRSAGQRVVFCGEGHAPVRLRELDPAIDLGLSWSSRTPPGDEVLARTRPSVLSWRWDSFEAAASSSMQERGYQVWVWEIAGPTAMASAIDDGVITDRLSDLVTRQRLDNGCGTRLGDPGAPLPAL